MAWVHMQSCSHACYTCICLHVKLFMLLCLTLCFQLVELREGLSIGCRVHFFLAFLLLLSNNNMYYKKYPRLSYNTYKVCLFSTSAYECVLTFSCSLCSQLGDWVCEKMLMARDSSRDETQKLHKKWLKHQAFMSELAQNKEWLDKIEKVSVEWYFFSTPFDHFCVSKCFH